MHHELNKLIFLGALAFAGCAHQGGDHHGAEHHGADHKGGEHAAMPASVKAFHDVLAPVYHLEKGAPRDEQACAALPKLDEAGKGVSAELSGEADKPKHEALGQALTALGAACQVPERTDVAAKLEGVHDAFHAYVDGEKH